MLGRTAQADYYMEHMDGYEDDDESQDPDGFISLKEWHQFFYFVSEDDTSIPETSASACKALDALEYGGMVRAEFITGGPINCLSVIHLRCGVEKLC